MGAFAWPGAVVLIVFGCALLFRANIGRAIDRTKKVGVGKTSVDMAEAQQQLATLQHQPGPTAMESLVDITESPYRAATRTELLHDLDARGLTGEERTRFLVEVISNFAIYLELERVYRRLLGSQIRAVQHTAQSPIGVAVDELRPFYDAVGEALMEGEPYPFDHWLMYLTRLSGLLVTNDEGRLFISPKGREFLKYCIDQALWLDKVL